MTSGASVLEKGSQAGAPEAAKHRGEVRPDIQGLRAVAVGVVVLFHAWPRRMPGGYVGVDVFFVISGFLISGHLLASPPRSLAGLTGFWARRIRRLLPAALLVLGATLVLTRLIAPAITWAHTAREVMHAAWYSENWSLASQSLDYLAADTVPTPVQHYWSLSVEEQFYLVWPLLIAAAWLVAVRLRRRPAGFVLLGLLVVVAISLVESVHTTSTQPARAYFVTWTRAWEFALGGVVAWVAHFSARRWRGFTADLAGWLGLGCIVAACFSFSAKTPFPGYAALLPVLGTGLVLLARSEGRVGPGFLWRLPGAQWLGDISYSVYLWHWPLLVLTPALLGSRLTWPVKLLIITLTLGLSHLTKTLVEDRFRFGSRRRGVRRTYALAATGMAAVTLLGSLQLVETDWRAAHARAQLAKAERGGDPCFGAGSIVLGAQACPVRPHAALVPDLSIAGDDKSDAYRDKCFTGAPYTSHLTCTYGNGPRRVALVGNSHAGHWLPALQLVAKQLGWTITTYLVSVCNVSDAHTSFPTSAQVKHCTDYGRWVYDQTKGSAYDLVITSERQSSSVPGTTWAQTATASAAGYESFLHRWSASGAHVLVLKDVTPPGPRGRLPECLAAHLGDRSACSWPLVEPAPQDPSAYRWMDPLYTAAIRLGDPHVSVVSVDDLLCPSGTCLPVIGTVVTYFDASHLTATYARTLAPTLTARITRALADG
jgi:peptidoglycan/LPS O-acetylase OafA/YrhL